MITLPSDVLESEGEGFEWDGMDGVHPNKETAMDWAEHQRIVCEARLLVQGDAPGAGVPKKVFKQLKSAFTELNSRSVVRVSKGIHQPKVDPHLQLRVTTDFGAQQSSHKFHLNVSAVAVADPGGLGDERFQWKGVQFSFVHTDGLTYKWPAVAAINNKGSHRTRRLSISTAGLQEHIDEQLRLQREAEAAAETEAFDKALETFIETYGSRSGKVSHTASNAGEFPSANFRKGNVNAKVSGGGNLQSKFVYYDKAKKEIIVGQYSRS